MNSDQLAGKWKQVSGKVKEKWGKLTDSDISMIKGQQDQLIGKIQERYGIAKEEAQKQVHSFVSTLDDNISRTDERNADTRTRSASRT